MSWATQYCAEPLTLSGGAEIKLTCVAVSEGNYQIIIEGTNLNGLGGSFYNPGAKDLRTAITSSTATKIVCEIAAESAPTVYTPLYVLCPGEQNISWPNDIEWGTCSDGDEKTASELAINATEKTLDASVPETFQIETTTAADYDGAITYASSKDGIATVSASGLVTAVGRGTATITVTAPETENFAASTKKLTVTVTGPINWEGVDWLTNSTQYKVVVDPEIGSQFGGIKKEDDNLWVGFPSAAFGACSIEYSAIGAGVSFPLSQFTMDYNQFTMVCQDVTYTFDVYNKDGELTDLSGINLALNKTANACINAATAGTSNNGNMGDRWASNGAKHYAAVGNDAEDWWSVDLGGFYEIDSIRIWFETAAPTDYDLLISNNGASWTVIGTYNAQPKTGQAATDANVYTFSEKVGRYVKIFARQGYADLAYGFSMWEFEVYGKRGTVEDANAPVLTKAELSGEPEWNQVKIAVAATDEEDGTVTSFHVVDATNGIDQVCTAVDGIITVTGLTGETTYNFTVTALDGAGNESNAIVVENVTTPIDDSVPLVAAAAPEARDAQWYRSLYSDTYTTALKHTFTLQNWGSTQGTEKVVEDNHYLLYDMSAGGTQVIWGENSENANAIVAKDEYRGSGTGVDASSMEYLHMDVWSKVAISGIKVLVNDDHLRTINLTGEGWQSIDIELANPVSANVNLSNVRWFKIVDINEPNRQKIAFDNIYFWRNAIDSDTEAPTDVTAEFAGSDLYTITLTLNAEEDNDDINYLVQLSGVDKATVAGKSGVAQSVVIKGLEAGTDYTFSVIAKDVVGNAAEAVEVNGSTKALPEAAPEPAATAANVKSLYSDKYESIVAISTYCQNWYAATTVHQIILAEENNTLYYDGLDNPSSFGWVFPAANAVGFQKLHMSIYPFKAGTIEIYPVIQPENQFHKVSPALNANEWNEVVLDYTENTFADFTQLGFTNYAGLGAFFLDNVYFFKDEPVIPSAIDNTNVGLKAVKLIENGQLIIIKNGIRYNVAGQVVK